MNPQKKILKARANLLFAHPFFGSLCLRMKPQEDTTCKSAWTDGETFGYNPHQVSNLSIKKLEGLLAHTVMHPACQHHKRRDGRDERVWNMACDYSINWILLEAGFDLPDGYLDDEKYHNKSAEDIYTELTKEFDQDGNPDIGEKQDGPKKLELEYEDGEGQGDGLEQSDDEKNQEESGDDSSDSDQKDEDSGDAKDDQNQDNNDVSADPAGTGEVRDSVDNDSGDGESGDETDKDWLLALAQAANQNRDSGDLPGGLTRLIETLLYPKLDWKELLSKFISARAKNDYSWSPPSRRHLYMDLYLPSLSTQQLPEVVLAIDVSGSISAEELNQFAVELSSILENYDTTLRVLWCDQQVTAEHVYSRADLPFDLSPEGGGGTDFRPVFKWIDDINVTPCCLLYLTDLQCNKFPDHEPNYPILWIKTGDDGETPPFGDIIELS